VKERVAIFIFTTVQNERSYLLSGQRFSDLITNEFQVMLAKACAL
jgi:hypothetical protein